MFCYRILFWFSLLLITDQVSSFQIRLADGGADFLGRVEVNLDDGSGWGTVCDDLWDEKEAKVVCRSLGLPYSQASIVASAKFGQGTGYIQMDDVRCNGSETSLIQCPYKNRTSENCGHGEDAGVVCWKKVTFEPVIKNSDPVVENPMDGALTLQLTDRQDFNISICNKPFGQNIAKVACFQTHGVRENSYPLTNYDASGISGTALCLKLNCTGRETSLSECSQTPVYLPDDDDVPPGLVCGYEKVNHMAIKASRLEGRYIFLDKELSTIQCETDFVRPKPSVSWYLDGNTPVTSWVNTGSIVSGSVYKGISNLTFIADDFTHGRILQCCSNDTLGHSLCTPKYNLFVMGVSKLLGLPKTGQRKMSNNGQQNLSNSAPKDAQSGILNSPSHNAIGYSLSAGVILVLSVVIAAMVYILHKSRNVSSQIREDGGIKEQLVMENYETVKKSNDYDVEQDCYDVPK